MFYKNNILTNITDYVKNSIRNFESSRKEKSEDLE
jgi:hypothetical protein